MEKQQLEAIIQLFEASSIYKMELEEGNLKIKLEKQPIQFVSKTPQTIHHVSNVEAAKPVEPVKQEVEGEWINSPIVGTYYQSNSKEAAPFIQVGDTVKKGDLLCIIEAMKVMNEIRSPYSGVILEIAVEDATMVEYQQAMIRIGESHV